jgi:hypothetical protein
MAFRRNTSYAKPTPHLPCCFMEMKDSRCALLSGNCGGFGTLGLWADCC